MMDAVEHLLNHHTTRHGISVGLAAEFGRPKHTPIPIGTVDDYIAKVNARWAEEAALTRAETRKRQLRRLYRRLSALKGAGNYREAAELEKLIAKIEGNLAPIKVEASTPPGKPIEVSVRDPRKMTSGERRKRIAELEAKKLTTMGAAAAVTTGATE